MSKGYKDTRGKVDLSFLDDFPRALIEVAQVMHFGSERYQRGNWLNGIEEHKLWGAMYRHKMSYLLGDKFAADSNLFHLAHMAANLLMLLELKLKESDTDMSVEDRLKINFIKPDNVMPKGNVGFHN